ncbi:MAG: hypothetical protein ABI981_12220 [Betaproteobacteria bacterium]
MGWIETLRYPGVVDRDESSEDTVINMPRRDAKRAPEAPVSDEPAIAEDVKQRQIALAIAYAAATRAR